MPRKRLGAGEIGNIHIRELASGVIQARACMRDDAGELHNVKGSGVTSDEATAALRENAANLSESEFRRLTGASTVAEACVVWLEEVRARAQTKTENGLSISTIESYEQTARTVVVAECGQVRLRDLNAGRCDRLIQGLRQRRSLATARRFRSILSQVCSVAVRHGALQENPTRNVRRLPASKKKESFLNPAQILTVRRLIDVWHLTNGTRTHFDEVMLRDGMDLMIATSARVGEAMAFRRRDVDVADTRMTILISGTMRQTRQEGLVRSPRPKRARQTRRVALPEFAATVVRRRLAITGPEPDALLFTCGDGKPCSGSKFRYLLRSFVEDNRDHLSAAGIVVEQFSTHMFRRTAATLVERAGGLSLASRLLGHANEATTRASYVVTAEQVDPITATILDDAMRDHLPSE